MIWVRFANFNISAKTKVGRIGKIFPFRRRGGWPGWAPEILENLGCYFSWSENLGLYNTWRGQAKVNGSPRLGWIEQIYAEVFFYAALAWL